LDSKTIYVLIVDWNGWRDTIECLDSVLGSVGENARIIVCDNGSSEDSAQKILDWAEGELVPNHKRPAFADVSWKPADTPISVRLVCEDQLATIDGNAQLTVIRSSQNRGFAGANNLMLRHVLSSNFDYVWLLNNDTVVARGALEAMVKRARQDRTIGMCGSKLVYYSHPEFVQAYGGAHFNAWTGRGHHLGEGSRASDAVDVNAIEKEMSYVIGASMLVSRSFLEKVGVMSEDYFLYFEEIDWATRGKGFKLAFAPESVVYHKVGATIGTGKNATAHSTTAEFYATRSRLIFASKHFRFRLPLVALALLGSYAKRLLSGQFANARALERAVAEFIAGSSNVH
jgi:hypothetical protein